jgi:hypothetical protein
VFAILGLRALYFLLAGVMDLFRFLNYGLSAVLVFVGAKMIAEWARHQAWLADQWGWDAHGEGHLVPPWLSLLIVVGLIGTSVAASMAFPGKHGGHGDELAGIDLQCDIVERRRFDGLGAIGLAQRRQLNHRIGHLVSPVSLRRVLSAKPV